MGRIGKKKTTPEYLEKTIEKLKESNKVQAKIIKNKDATIKQLTGEVVSLSYQLRVLNNKYEKISEIINNRNKAFKKDKGE